MLRCIFVLLLASACGGKTSLDADGATGDAWAAGAVIDAQVADAQVIDAQMIDARVVVDTGTPDAAVVDEQSGDGSVGDACEQTDCSVTLPVPIEQEAYVKANDTQPGDLFGNALDVDGDTLVVGAPWTMREDPHFGAVHVFVRSAGTWTLQSTITVLDGFGFGSAVSISGDTIAARDRSGSLYVFVRAAGAWRREAFLDASDPSDKLAGRAVAIDGDTLAFEAALDDTAAPMSGAVYVWTRSGGIWAQQDLLKSATPARFDGFGGSIAIANDSIVVGAASQTPDVESAAYVFVRSGGTWTQQGYLQGTHSETLDQFGTSVAISGDTIVVGAPGEASVATGINGDQSDNSAQNSGAAYVFVRRGEAWTQVAYVKASNNEPSWYRGGYRGWSGDNFGFSVALHDNMIVVGAMEEESDATGVNGDQHNNDDYGSGAAYVFTRAGDVWSQVAYLKAGNNRVNEYSGDERFGGVVAVSGETIAVGATGESSDATGINGDQTNYDATSSGAVYVFRVSP